MVKRGRPLKEDKRDNGYRLRMNDEELAQLEELQEMHRLSKAEIIRNALADYYRKSKKRKTL